MVRFKKIFKLNSNIYLKKITSADEKILPENMKTEKICLETWQSETKCECVWESGPNRQNSRKKRFESIDNTARRLFDTHVENAETLPGTQIDVDVNQWRQQNVSTDSEPSLLNGDMSDDEYGVIVSFCVIYKLFLILRSLS